MSILIEHWFWLLITSTCVLWYSTITIYVAIRGVIDIKGMLGRLSRKREQKLRDGDDGANAQDDKGSAN